MTVIATDGYRLSLKSLDLSAPGDLNVVIPSRALAEVAKVSGEEKDATSINMVQNDDGQLIFVVGESEIHTRAIAGEYPDIEKIIPKIHNTRVLVDTVSLSRAVKSAAVFAGTTQIFYDCTSKTSCSLFLPTLRRLEKTTLRWKQKLMGKAGI